MPEGTKHNTLPATLSLFGHRPTAAHLDVLYRPRSARLTRAAISLLGFWAIAPLVFFIPPHIPWVLLALGLGIYFAHASWKAAYEVQRFEGSCPRCGSALEIETGSKIRPPHKLTCYNCHQQPYLEMTEVPD